ncbi:PTS sugar transporter subunit IIA [Legionella impletisoli]|uniref:PTS IIA-like nitrogen-regulatory protein PtsN n=1 Tax=Legionella impletisoli TaxID=343510 RepID=A0A917JVZ6_9GAMM|nr:PTS sugar transporter subunit IIA [Legionella impletisoli]GGI86360.1 PTS IIA-like nitrogen-regulatory protein PtsN [Legionella impletisoli]
MSFRTFLDPNRICIDSAAQSKTAVLLKISQLLSQTHPDLEVESLFDAFWRRDSLGSTAIGHGIIIPHIRSALINHTLGCFIKLQHPVDFGAEDKQPIDLVFGLIGPQENPKEHLQILKSIIKHVSKTEFRQACRLAKDNETLQRIFYQETERLATNELESLEL